MIRNTRHTMKFTNTGKLARYSEFLTQYTECVQYYIDWIWDHEIRTTDKKGRIHVFDIKNRRYDLQSYLSTTQIPIPDSLKALSARARKAAITQAIGVIRAVTDKYQSKSFVRRRHQKAGTTTKLQSFLDTHAPTKPAIDQAEFKAELNSNCCEFHPVKTPEFDGFIEVRCIGDKFGRFRIPIKFTERDQHWKSKPNSELMKSFLFDKDMIDFRWNVDVPKKTAGDIIGADPGQLTTVSMSDANQQNRQVTPDYIDPSGNIHNLKTINDKMAIQKPGSKAQKRTKQEMINYVNWSIKQLNLSEIKQINLESNKFIKFGKNTSKSLKHWSFSLINKAIHLIAEEQGVLVELQNQAYKSQRCNSCGWVDKDNRAGKEFTCESCGHTDDSDMNSAANQAMKLPVVPVSFRKAKLNREGFFWLESGFFSLDNKELTVPCENHV